MNYKCATPVLLIIVITSVLRNTNAGRSRPAIRGVTISTTSPSPSTVTSSLGGLRGYRRFHANDSHVGSRVRCTPDEKICFRHNLIFDPKSDSCQPMGGGVPQGCDLMPNRTEFELGSGHIVGICKKYQDPCPGYRMAYDSHCYHKKTVRDAICGCRSEPTRHFLGGMECRCSLNFPKYVEQPVENGWCRIPDFRSPNNLASSFKLLAAKDAFYTKRSPTRMDTSQPSCHPEQKKCFAIGQVWVSRKKNCFPLLQQGPCEKDHVVVMPRDSWLSAECQHINGDCPMGQIRMVFDGKCHDIRKTLLTAPGKLDLDIFGQYVVLNHTETRSYVPAVFNDECIIFSGSRVSRSPSPVKYPKPPCVRGNSNLCFLHKVYSDPPKAEITNLEENEV